MDLSTDVQGRKFLDLCISNRFRILNGQHNCDSQGRYTCYTNRRCSVVDYVIVSANMQCRITNFCVAALKTYSNHCPLEFTFTVTVANPSTEAQTVRTDSEDMNNMSSKLIINNTVPLKWEKITLYKFPERKKTWWKKPSSYKDLSPQNHQILVQQS